MYMFTIPSNTSLSKSSLSVVTYNQLYKLVEMHSAVQIIELDLVGEQ